MVRMEVNDPVVVDQIGGRSLTGRVRAVNTDDTYTIQYDDGSRERVGEHLVKLYMPARNLAKEGSDLFMGAMNGNQSRPSLSRERSDEVLTSWYLDGDRCIHHAYGTTRPIEDYKHTTVYTSDGGIYSLGDPDRAFLRFLRESGLRYDARSPLSCGVTRLARAHQVMRAGKQFDLIKDALKSISGGCNIRAGTREDDAVRRCLVEINDLKRHLTASFLN